VHFTGYNFASAFCLQFCLEIYKFLFCSFCWKLVVATTALNFEHIPFLAHIFCLLLPVLFAQFLTLGCHPTQHTVFFCISFLPLTLFVHIILIVSYLNLQTFFLCLNPNSTLLFLCIVLPYSGYNILLFLERLPHKSLDLTCIF
jgi:hypothetical protein